MADTARLKSIRAAYKGHCTRNITRANAIMASTTPELDELDTILERVVNRMEAIAGVDRQIETKVEDGELEAEINEALQYNDELTDFKNKVSKFLLAKRPFPAAPPSASSSVGVPLTDSVVPGATASISQTSTVKLPKIRIKDFSGDPLEWLSFWDSFDSSVGQNTRISNVDKMNYLKVFLQGEASHAINGLSLSNSNYDEAVTILKRRFGQEQMQINAYMEAY